MTFTVEKLEFFTLGYIAGERISIQKPVFTQAVPGVGTVFWKEGERW